MQVRVCRCFLCHDWLLLPWLQLHSPLPWFRRGPWCFVAADRFLAHAWRLAVKLHQWWFAAFVRQWKCCCREAVVRDKLVQICSKRGDEWIYCGGCVAEVWCGCCCVVHFGCKSWAFAVAEMVVSARLDARMVAGAWICHGWMREDGFDSHIPKTKKSLYGSGSFATETKRLLLVSSQYASGLKPRHNDENNGGQKPLLH